MNGSPLLLTRARAWTSYTFGRNGTSASDKYPRGTGRVRLVNTDATNLAVIMLRIWVTLQRFTRKWHARQDTSLGVLP